MRHIKNEKVRKVLTRIAPFVLVVACTPLLLLAGMSGYAMYKQVFLVSTWVPTRAIVDWHMWKGNRNIVEGYRVGYTYSYGGEVFHGQDVVDSHASFFVKPKFDLKERMVEVRVNSKNPAQSGIQHSILPYLFWIFVAVPLSAIAIWAALFKRKLYVIRL